ncbi:MAG: HEAT repeat domain-containing protein [Planctomycetota bacterium]
MFAKPVLASISVLLAGACTAPTTQADFDSPHPTARLYAIERAGAERDRTATARLVEQLDSDDPMVQMLALESLLRIEGDTHGYWHGDPPHVRRAAIEQWVDHVSGDQTPADPPAGTTTDDDG